jgi:excisionase family DNA binding protein
MLTIPELARQLNRDPETIRRWIRAGKLRARKVGTQHVVDEADVASFLKPPRMPVPPGWDRTMTGEPMPDVVSVVRGSRARH